MHQGYLIQILHGCSLVNPVQPDPLLVTLSMILIDVIPSSPFSLATSIRGWHFVHTIKLIVITMREVTEGVDNLSHY